MKKGMGDDVAWAAFTRRPAIKKLMERYRTAPLEDRERLCEEIDVLWQDEIDHHRE